LATREAEEEGGSDDDHLLPSMGFNSTNMEAMVEWFEREGEKDIVVVVVVVVVVVDVRVG